MVKWIHLNTKEEMKAQNLAGLFTENILISSKFAGTLSNVALKTTNKKRVHLLPLSLTKYENKYATQTWHFCMGTVFFFSKNKILHTLKILRGKLIIKYKTKQKN